MKKSGITIIFIIGCIGVLFVAYVIGLGIKQVRFRQARIESKTSLSESATAQIRMSTEQPEPSSPNQPQMQRAEPAQVPSEARPVPGQEGRRPFRGMTEEERAKLKERWQNMSEEEREQEREKRRAEMRERFGDRQPLGHGQRQNEEE
jgi:hypothetical protein